MKENNLRYQVYFNILIKFIEIAIQGKFKEINLARTAIEIKSSVGAVPVDLVCYLTHRNRIVNHLVPNLIQYLKPDEQFTIRKPFKKNLIPHQRNLLFHAALSPLPPCSFSVILV